MIDYDQIACAMYEAYMARAIYASTWAELDALEQAAWIAAAKAAHKELKEVK